MRQPVLVLTSVALLMGGCGRTVPPSPVPPKEPAPASSPQPPPPQTAPSTPP